MPVTATPDDAKRSIPVGPEFDKRMKTAAFKAAEFKIAAITYSRLATTIGRAGLTAVFGMGTGVSLHVTSPQPKLSGMQAGRQGQGPGQSSHPKRACRSGS